MVIILRLGEYFQMRERHGVGCWALMHLGARSKLMTCPMNGSPFWKTLIFCNCLTRDIWWTHGRELDREAKTLRARHVKRQEQQSLRGRSEFCCRTTWGRHIALLRGWWFKVLDIGSNPLKMENTSLVELTATVIGTKLPPTAHFFLLAKWHLG